MMPNGREGIELPWSNSRSAKQKRPSKRRGIGSHTKQGNGQDELWLTPPAIIEMLGGWNSFDLDPCACPHPRPWPTARTHFALPEKNGLKLEWGGRIWLNPPYGDKLTPWLARMADHRNGMALIFARTETESWTRWVWPFAKCVLFIAGRLTFYLPDGTQGPGNSGGPSALIAYGDHDTQELFNCGIAGTICYAPRVKTWTTPLLTKTAPKEEYSVNAG